MNIVIGFRRNITKLANIFTEIVCLCELVQRSVKSVTVKHSVHNSFRLYVHMGNAMFSMSNYFTLTHAMQYLEYSYYNLNTVTKLYAFIKRVNVSR